MGFGASSARPEPKVASGSAAAPLMIHAGIGKINQDFGNAHNIQVLEFTTQSRHTSTGI
jgi:hypothetical protein